MNGSGRVPLPLVHIVAEFRAECGHGQSRRGSFIFFFAAFSKQKDDCL